jgi:flavin reductase like protein
MNRQFQIPANSENDCARTTRTAADFFCGVQLTFLPKISESCEHLGGCPQRACELTSVTSSRRKGLGMLFEFSKLQEQRRYKLLNAAPFSWFNMVAIDLPMICFGISFAERGNAKDAGNNIRATGQFTVNLVSRALADRMNVTAIEFATRDRRGMRSRLDHGAVPVRHGPSYRREPAFF